MDNCESSFKIVSAVGRFLLQGDVRFRGISVEGRCPLWGMSVADGINFRELSVVGNYLL